MRRSIKSAIALLAVSALPLIAVAPSAASVAPDLSTFVFDCIQHDDANYDIPIYGDSVEITFENCTAGETVLDLADTGFATISNVAVEDINPLPVGDMIVTADADIEVRDGENNWSANLRFEAAYDMPNPAGVQLVDSSQSIPVSAPEVSYGTAEEISLEEEIEIGGVTECGIIPGVHVYATQTFTVNLAGDYAFRVTGVDPVTSYHDELHAEDHPFSDPMVALYEGWNPASTASGIVGCNDDLNDLTIGGHDFSEPDFNLTQQGDYIEGHYSYFEATELQPGVYTMVFTTWGAVSSSEWAAGDDGSDEWAPAEATVYFDVWGPEDGLVAGSLAATGVEPGLALWSGLALAGTGVAITVARRRSQRQ